MRCIDTTLGDDWEVITQALNSWPNFGPKNPISIPSFRPVGTLIHEQGHSVQNHLWELVRSIWELTARTGQDKWKAYLVFHTRLSAKTLPFSEQLAKCIPQFRPNQPEHYTLKGGTHPYGHLRGVTPVILLPTRLFLVLFWCSWPSAFNRFALHYNVFAPLLFTHNYVVVRLHRIRWSLRFSIQTRLLSSIFS